MNKEFIYQLNEHLEPEIIAAYLILRAASAAIYSYRWDFWLENSEGETCAEILQNAQAKCRKEYEETARITLQRFDNVDQLIDIASKLIAAEADWDTHNVLGGIGSDETKELSAILHENGIKTSNISTK